MGIQINGLTDVISAGDGSLSIQGSDLTNLSQLSVTGVGTFKTLVLAADGSEKARIDSSGRLLVGTATSITSDTNSVIEATNALGAHVALGRLDGVINGGEVIGKLSFNSNDHDGAGTIWQECASITANADGVYRLNDKPTRLVFSTTADEASSPTEQLRITSDRYVRLASGTGGIQFNGDTAAANALDDYEEGTFTPIDSSGAGLSFTSTSGHYTKVGNICYVSGALTFPSTANTNSIIIGGLPFFPSTGTLYQNFGPPIRNNKSLNIQIFGVENTTFLVLPIGSYTTYTTNSQMSVGTMQFSYTYQTA